jgi:hypothetical protein
MIPMAVETTNIADLLEALRAWLLNNPEGDLQDFAAQHDCTVEDLTDAWTTYFSQAADFSRNYDLNTTQAGYQGGAQSATQAAAAYTPAPPPHGGSPAEYKQYLTQEIYNYQEYTTVNNITDNSFNQQIFAGGDVNQNIDLDHSVNTVGEDGVLIRDSELDDTLINTGDRAVQQQGDGNQANTGDVTQNVSDGGAASVFGDSTTVGSGNDFGAGSQGAVNAALGDGNKQANQQQDNDTNINVGDTTGGTGGAGTGGDGGFGGNANAAGGFGGDGGDGGFLGDGGDGGNANAAGGFGGDASGGDGLGGDGGDANVDVRVDNNQNIDFGS